MITGIALYALGFLVFLAIVWRAGCIGHWQAWLISAMWPLVLAFLVWSVFVMRDDYIGVN